ncbi:hypothetical protein FRC09_003158 [Ceratobasidium sp. 395]|nr:hypothetical protein FRC09_003158 [Ceratobasidium sp. 395]
MPPRLWHWYYFGAREEGVAKSKQTDCYSESRVFFKTWCNTCLAQKINELRQSDANSRANGQITQGRTQDELRKDAMDDSDAIPGRREVFEAHILSCKSIDPRAKQRVQQGTGSTTIIDQMVSGVTLNAPSDSKQRDFESNFWKLFIANGFAWHAVNHLETRNLFGTWTPGAKLPDRHKLSGLVLAREVTVAEASMNETM